MSPFFVILPNATSQQNSLTTKPIMPIQRPLLLETIKIKEGVICNLPYHQKRMNYSRTHLFQTSSTIDLASKITIPSQKGIFRCRVLYAQTIESVTYTPYTPKHINTLHIVSSNIEYHHKYANREVLDSLLSLSPQADDIIIEKDGLLTDTTIANIAFFAKGKWYTPKKPLLEGTMRAKLLDKGMLHLRDIAKKNMEDYTHVALINAMVGFKVLNQMTIKQIK
ncbi:MAG: aminotransferase class IV [Sulfurovum sp.]|nr:aminotransferase class IV [Sulfurovum sp.]MCB4759054.1 aminotransferase class IV [Sulfurovum sp.]MCB4764363.1 aminotransferase class IV [Sulfurovum sp.]